MLSPKYRIYATLLDSFSWYKKSEDEGAKQEFIDKINRVQTPKSDAQIRGTAFNDLVDAVASGSVALQGEETKIHDTKCENWIIREFANKFTKAANQAYVETVIDTMHGAVLIYGYMDEIVEDVAFDIKTCSKYEFPKYLHNWQHPAYLECLKASAPQVKRFKYLVTDFNNIFEEEYAYSESDSGRLKSVCGELIEFLEINRSVITDGKIFA